MLLAHLAVVWLTLLPTKRSSYLHDLRSSGWRSCECFDHVFFWHDPRYAQPRPDTDGSAAVGTSDPSFSDRFQETFGLQLLFRAASLGRWPHQITHSDRDIVNTAVHPFLSTTPKKYY